MQQCDHADDDVGDECHDSGAGFVANHFDVVPVRTDDESRIVGRVVVRTQARRAIVLAARLQRRAMERFDAIRNDTR